MAKALELAREAGRAGEIPVGAVIVNQHQQIIACGANSKERTQDPTAHAEIVAIRCATHALQDWHLNQCTMYVTLEPCPMCAGAILQARLKTLVYGTDDPKTGAIRTVINLPDSPASFHRLEVIAGVLQWECQSLLQDWFRQLRQQKRKKLLPYGLIPIPPRQNLQPVPTPQCHLLGHFLIQMLSVRYRHVASIPTDPVAL